MQREDGDSPRVRLARTCAILVAGLGAVAACRSQNLLFCPSVGQPGALVGKATLGVDDVDRDSIPDVAIGAPGDSVAGPGRGAAYVCSGRDGAVLYVVRGERDNDRLGESLAVIGDLDRDGIDDFAVGSPHGYNLAGVTSGYVRLHSGADGRVLRRLDGVQASEYFGTSIAGLGDVNGDGVPDFAVGAPDSAPLFPPRSGFATVFSGADGSLLHRFSGTNAYDACGQAVAGIGDIDNDGRPDILVAWARTGSPNVPKVVAYSGRTGATLFTVLDTATRSGFGTSLAPLGDVNGDGRADFAVGAPSASRVEVYSVDGRRLWGVSNGAAELLGTSVCRIGDIDGDGADDLAVGGPGQSALGARGRVLLLSGRTGVVQSSLTTGIDGDGFGSSVGAAGDLDDDGRADFVVGAPGLFPRGQACLYARLEARFGTFGAGCAGVAGTPRLTATGVPRLGQQFEINVHQLAPVRVGIVLFGVSDRIWLGIALPADLGPFGMPGCRLLASAEVMIDVSTGLGATRVVVHLPTERTLLRVRLFHQCLSLDETANPLGLVTSNGGVSTIGI